MAMTLTQLAERLGAELRGDAGAEVTACATLDDAGPGDVSFIANPRYAARLRETQAGAIVVGRDHIRHARDDHNLLIADDPYFAFREAMVVLMGFGDAPAPGISAQAHVADSARVGQGCYIGPFAVIADGARLGERCRVYPHVYVGEHARVGDDVTLHPQVTIYSRCVVGDRVTLHAGCSIGQDGFGYATHGGVHHKIPPTGNAVIEDDVEMGAHCSVDRATMGSTVVGGGSKFSNAVTIGHGSRLGRGNLIVAQVGVAGSTTTGDYVVMGGQAGVAGHLHIGDGAQLAAKSGVVSDLPGGAQYGGAPAQPLTDAKRQVFAAAKLPSLFATVRRLEKRIAAMEARVADRT
ncbi:MAG: UDP-3-O-(3-hydroxymyristoyl)glucosamine N-acyltransferase [Phycisphaeraceae bacterium]